MAEESAPRSLRVSWFQDIWGKNHLDTDTSMTTIAKTLRELTSWAHPDHFPEFVTRSKDHHDLLHNGFLVITMAVANLKTTLRSGGTVGGISASMPVPEVQKEYFLRPTVALYTSVWDTVEKQASQSTAIFFSGRLTCCQKRHK